MNPSNQPLNDGRAIGKRRRHLGLSQEVLSRLAEMSTYTLGGIENGRRSVKGDELQRLNAVLGAFESAYALAQKAVAALQLAS